MPGRAAAPLQGSTEHRIAHVARDVKQRAEGLRLFGRQPLVVNAGEPIGMHMPLENLDIVHRVRQHHDAARRVHDVVVELVR
jgi:hypothetical protein